MSDRRWRRWGIAGLWLLGALPAWAGQPPGDALWVAQSEGVLRVEEGSGEVVLEADAGEDVRAVAFDAARRVLWAFSPGWLRAFGEAGEERAAIPVSAPPGRAFLAVDSTDGSVALAAGRGLWRFDAGGTPLGALPLDGRVRGLAFDPARQRLWVATPSSLRAYDPGLRQIREAALAKDSRLAAVGLAGESGAIWTAGNDRLSRLGGEGRLLFEQAVPGILAVAGDFRGGAWAATARELLRVGPGGRILARLEPFAGAGTITALAVQPRDGSVWVANEVDLARVAPTGRVMRRVSPEPPVRLRALALALAAADGRGRPEVRPRLRTKSLTATQAAVVGFVRLPNGLPAVGATVTVLGQNGPSATTDAAGNFSLTPIAVPAGGGQLEIVATLATASGSLYTTEGLWAAGGTTTDIGEVDLLYVCDAAFKTLPTPAPNGTVKALAVFDDGSGPALFVGGAFTTVGGLTVNGIAKWNGTAWSALGAGLGGTTPEVDALAVFNDGGGARLYAAGKFTKSGTATVNYVAKWSGTAWSQVGTGLASQVNALAVWSGSLYAGGSFTTVGSTNFNRLARWNGTAWSTVGGGVGGNVQALVAYDDGGGPALYVGGAFTTAGAVTANRIAKWNGTAWSALGASGGGVAGGTPEVDALAVWDDGGGPALFVGGKFTTANNTAISAKYVARWRGGSWSALGTGLGTQVLALAAFDDGTGPALYAGGAFTTLAGIPYNRLASWDGENWNPVVEGVDNTVYALAALPSGAGAGLYLGGAFSTASGSAAGKILRWWRPTSCTDTTSPYLFFTQPAYGSTVTSPTPTIGLGFSDGGSGIDTSTLAIQANGAPLAVHCTFGGGWGQCTPDAPLAEGAVTLDATIKDLAGNPTDGPAEVQFTIQDTVAPDLGITSPVGGAVVTSAYPVLQIHADDHGGSGVDPSSVTVTSSGGNPLAVDCRFTGSDPVDAQCVPVAPLPAGLAGLTLRVKDRSGNGSAPASVSFTVAPAPLTTTLHGTVRFAGGSPAAGATVKVNEEPQYFATTGADGAFSLAGPAAAAGTLLSVTASWGPPALTGFAGHLAPVAGGVTEVGTITLQASCDLRFRPVPLAPTDGSLENRQSGSLYPLTGAAAVYDDGTGAALYLAGAFTHAGGHEVDGIAKWTGSAWQPVGGGALGNPDAAVNALAVYDDGSGAALYAAGDFTSIGGQPAARFGRWDGHAWSEVGQGLSAGVSGMALYDDGSGPALYLLGSFTSVQPVTTWDGRNLGIAAAGFARWNGHQWTPLPAPSSDHRARLKTLDDGGGPALYALALDGLFKWSPAAGSWTQILGATDLQPYPNKTLADFTVANAGGAPALYVAGLHMGVLKRNGATWQQLLSANASIASLAAITEAGQPQLYAAGSFATNGPVKLGRWNGTAWTQPLADGKLLFVATGLGASPVLYGGEAATGFTNTTADPARWSGSAWVPLTAAGDTTGSVTSAVAFDDGGGGGEALFFAGPMTAGGVALNGGIGRWDGTRVTAVGSGLEAGGSAVFVLDDGTGPALYAVAGAAGRIARWNGSGWTTLGSPLGVQIATLAVADLGSGPRLYAAGNGVFRWNGAFWASLGGPGSVLALAGFQGTLYAGGGSFWVPSEVLQRYDGAAWSAVSGAPDDTVEALEVWNGALYLGGSFVRAGGASHFGLAAYGGSSWLAFGGCGFLGNRDFSTPVTPIDGTVHALKALDAGGASQLVIGGDYLSSCDSSSGSSYYAHRLPYSYVNLGTGVSGPVHTLAVSNPSTGPEVVVGGDFVTAGGQPAGKLAVWTTLPSFGQCAPAGQPPVITLTAPADGAATSGSQQAFSGHLDEPASLAINGQPLPVAADLTFISPPLQLALGANVFTLTATDEQGLTRQLAVTVTRDPVPPSLTLTSPAAGATVPTARPTLVVAYDDPGGSGVVPATLAFTVDGSPLAASCVSDGAGARCTPAAALPTGGVTVAASVADRAGNAASASVAFTVAPAAGATATVTGGVARADGSAVAGATVTVLGKSAASAITGADGRFTIAGVDVSDGSPLALAAEAADPAHSGSARVGTASVTPVPGGTVDAGTIVLRTSCAPRFTAGLFAGIGVTGGSPARVSAAAVFDDGHGPALYVGGLFTAAGGVPASNLAKWDGHAWSAVGGGIDGAVQALAVFDDGSGPALYAAGDFANASAFPGSPYTPASRVAKWNGTAWSALGAGLGGKVYALAVWNGALYAGGGLNVPYVDRWNPGTATWSAAGTGAPDGTVYSFGVFNGALYAGGFFNSIGGVAAHRVARWDGAAWSALGAGTSGAVYSLAAFDDGSGPALYAGGTFTNAGDLVRPVDGIARWTGSAWAYAGDQLSTGGVLAEGPQGVEALTVYDDGGGAALYALGMLQGESIAGIARFKAGSWSALGTGIATPGYGGAALAVYDDGSGAALFAGSDFALAGQLGVSGVARWRSGVWSALGSGLDGTLAALAVYDDGTGPALHAGGTFIAASGRTIAHAGRWNGSGWAPLGTGTDDRISALAVAGAGPGALLYAAGDFTRAGGLPAAHAARWDGNGWSPLGGGLDGPARALAMFDAGNGPSLYAGGTFATAGGIAASHVARWDGAAWSALGAGADGPVLALAGGAVAGGPRLFAAGAFAHAGGVTAANVAAWDGSSWSALGPGLAGEVDSLAVYDDGSGAALYAGGAFTTSGGTTVAHLARWTGSVWVAVGGGTDGTVSALAVFDDGSGPALYAGGSFTTAGGVTVNGLARWNGASWSPLGDGTSAGTGVANGAVLALQPFAEASGPALYAGGSFGLAGGQPSVAIARWARALSCFAADSTAPTLAFTAPAAGAVSATATPQLAFAWSDDESGVDPASLLVQANGAPLTVACTAGTATAQCTPQAPLAEGTVSLSATVADHAGNRSAPATLAFTVDTQAPALAFASPAAASFVGSGSPPVSLTWSDAGSGVDPATLTLTGPVPFTCAPGASGATCLPGSPLADGTVQLSATVADRAGHSATVTLAFTVDVTAPSLAFQAPAEGSTVPPAATLQLSWSDAGSGIDAASLALTDGGSPLAASCTTSPAGAVCTPGSPLAVGAHTVAAAVADRAGRSASATVRFTVPDPVQPAPQITLTAPADGAITTAATIGLTGSVSKPAALTINGVAVPLDGANGFAYTAPLAEGSDRFDLVATDSGNRTGTATVTVVRDSTPPVLSILEPKPDAYHDPATPLQLLVGDSGTGIDPATLTLTLNGSPLAADCTVCAPLVTCIPQAALPAGALTLTAAVRDRAGSPGTAGPVRFTSQSGFDITPPVITVSSPVSGAVVTAASLHLLGTVSEPAALTVNGAPVTLDAGFGFDDLVTLAEGINSFTLVATDGNGNAASLTLTVTLDSAVPGPVDPSKVTVTAPAGGFAAVNGAAGSVAPVRAGWTAVVTDLLTGATVTVPVGADGGFTASVAAQGGDTVSVAVQSTAGVAGPSRAFPVPGTPQLPADPATLAPALDRTVATDLCAATAFLYGGANPVQTGVAPGAIECRRAAVLRGRVRDRSGAPLGAVRVSVLRHPELGSTLSRGDGAWDLAVNGGGEVVVQLARPGYLPVQRKVAVSWGGWGTAPDVVLVPLDPQATAVDLTASTPFQVARGSAVTDPDGARQATLLFPQGTQAALAFPGGATQPIHSLTVRATEYTVGPTGPQAMPGELPPTTGYTYAVELSVDEATAAGASEVRFDRPVITYLENFLHFPAGTVVPVGYYDRVRAFWLAAALDGRVIDVLTVASGTADLDVDGSGQPASAATLAGLGITDAERQQIAALYTAGQSLWRVPVTHFTPYDYNWALQPLQPGANLPKENPPAGGDKDKKDDPCLCSGSILEAENQILGEVVGLAGTPFTLNYRSDRVPGRKIADTLDIPLSKAGLPGGVKRIDLEVDVAGQTFSQSFSPAAGQSFNFTWDGKDSYGRTLQGRQPYSSRIGYVYDGEYSNPQPGCSNCFGDPGAGPLPVPSRQDITFWQKQKGTLGIWDSQSQLYLGGWSLSVHHAFDPVDKILYYGDGRRRNAADARVLTVVAGNGSPDSGGDGGPAPQAAVSSPTSVVAEPDGTLHVVANGSAQVRKVAPDGTITTEAGKPRVTDPSADPGPRGDGGPAKLARLWNPVSAALGPDGLLYIADRGDQRIVRIEEDGTLTNVIGPHTPPPGGKPPLIEVTDLPWTINEIAFGPDGKLYVTAGTAEPAIGTLFKFDLTWNRGKLLMSGRLEADSHHNLIWNENYGNPTSNQIFLFNEISSVAFDSFGDLYFSLAGGGGVCPTIWYRTFDGVSHQFAGSYAGSDCNGYSGDGGQATEAKLRSPRSLLFLEDGSLIFADTNNHVVRRIEFGGQIRTIAGIGTGGNNGSGRPPQQTQMLLPYAVTKAPDHDLLVADADNVVRGDQSDFQNSQQSGSTVQSEQIRIASDDGAAVYVFDGAGRHLWTEDARTGLHLLTFGYDTQGYLVSVTDNFANVTTVERDASGRATAVVAPFGQRTGLAYDANGYLAAVNDPAAEEIDFTYSSDGLLQSMTDPKRRVYHYTFDALGRLQKDEDPLHGFTALARTEDAAGSTVTKSTAMGRATAYKTETLPDGGTRRTVTSPDGSVSTSVVGLDGTRMETSADGTVATSLREPDPRLGMQAPAETSVTVRTPAGLTSTTSSSRTVALIDPAGDPKDAKNLASVTETATVNGRAMTSVRDFQSNLLTVTTPGGRQTVTQFDAFGRVSESRPPGMLPIDTSYDARGRVSTVSQGDRHATYTYDAQGRLQSVADALSQPVSYTYDAVGRVKTETLPDSRVIQFDYDANGNLTAITPPGRPAHDFDHNAIDLGTEYTPPDVGAGTNVTTASYNLDRQLEAITRPDGQTIQYAYDPASGRLNTVAVPQGTYTYGYQAGSGNLTSVSDPDGGALAFTYDGSLLTGVTWSGTVAGSIGLTYNNNFELIRRTVDGANPVDFSYDSEGQLHQAGALVLNRTPQTGLLTGTVLGNATDTYAYDSFGAVQSYAAQYGGNGLFTESFTRDQRGRISQKVETIGGATATYSYTYDPAGRLTEVRKDGAVFEHYDYDANSNRTSWTDPVGSGTATYDAQDRLLAYGGNAYTYSANGELATKTGNGQTLHYTYDVAGNLRTVLFPDGLQIDYVIDAANRRVGKKVNGILGKGYLYKDGLSPVAELDGTGNVVSLFVYGSRTTVPAYMIQGGATYRLFTDHLGSVRLVVNTTDGSIAQRIDYDAFGRIILDTNPGFQPFGFAGGLYDPQTGLTRFGARDYDAETGRWTSKDPAGFGGGDTNLYGYVVNDPVNSFDPTGLYDWEDLLQDAGNISAGFADTITLGLTRKIRHWQGLDQFVQECSGGYTAGQIGGAVWGIATGEAGELAAAGGESALIKGGISVASGAGGDLAPMQLVRVIQRGEKIVTIMQDAKEYSWTTGNEVALVKLASGERALVSGGPGGINFEEGAVTRIFGHTHPWDAPTFGPSRQDVQALESLGQKSSYILERGQLIKFGVK